MSAAARTQSHVTGILERIIRPDEGTLNVEAAKSLLGLVLDDRDRTRAHDLTVKNQEGTLTAAEEVELDSYRRVGRLIDLLQAKARRSIQRTDSNPVILGDG